jgi:hypothetical protein
VPVARYDKDYGGKKGSAAKARRAMIAQYGLSKGLQVFHATARRNERRKR